MKGEIIIIKGDRIKAGKQIMRLLCTEITKSSDKFVISIAGESGSGKSGLAVVLSRTLADKEINNVIFDCIWKK